MIDNNTYENKALTMEPFLEKLESFQGVDVIYLFDSSLNLIYEKNKSSNNINYVDQLKNILKVDSISNEIGTSIYSKPFHTYTLLNENGLIIISKLKKEKFNYLAIIGGENEPVDLLNLLRLVKEIQNQPME